MQFLIAFVLLLAIAANEWPTPLTGVPDNHRIWGVLSVQLLLSGLACFRWGRWEPTRSWYPMICWTLGSLIVTVGLGWSQWVAARFGTFQTGSAIVVLLPHLASLVLVWVIPLTFAAVATPSRTDRNWAHRWATILGHLRVRFQWQLLPILLPLLTVLVMRDVFEQSHTWQSLTWTLQIGILASASMMVVLLGFPVVIKWWLPTQPFADALFQKHLDSTARQLKLKLREVAEWNTQQRIANALVLGWLPGTRRILISDVLSWALTKRQLYAVFLHEAGHLRHHHLWWRLSVIVLAGQILLLGSIATEREFDLVEPNAKPEMFLAILGLVGLLLLTGLLMGLVSRALEFEADGFALHQLKALGPPEPTTDKSDSSGREGADSRIEDLITAIRSTAELTGISLTHSTWLHPSVNDRIQRIRLCFASPVLHELMQRRLRILKFSLMTVILLCAGLLAMHGLLWTI
ncbi:MAG: M48 family metalloprotease [Planctomycetaceae bacterium]|nr:M48 family metalloprotease [Planctomycetaceae bacterium]